MRHASTAALTALLCLPLAGPATAQSPAHIWSHAFLGSASPDARLVATRLSNVWIAGMFTTNINLIGATYASPKDAYVAMYSTNGEYQWSQAFGDAGTVLPSGIGVDSGDNVYITGQFSGTVNFGGSDLVSAGGNDTFLAKFNSAGTHQWSKRFGEVSTGEGGFSLVIDSGNNVIIGGYFSGTVNFGGSNLTSAGGTDAYIAKFNSAGTHQWSFRFGDAQNQSIEGLSTTPTDLYATGYFYGAVNFGGSNLTSAGQSDVFLVKFNSSGVHQWSQRFGGTSYDFGRDVDSDAVNVVLATNVSSASVTFGGASLIGAGSNDVAIAKFNTAGTHSWSRRYGDQDTQLISAIDLSGTIYIAGNFEGTIDFGGAAPLVSAGNQDFYLAKLLITNGDPIWLQRYGNSGSDSAYDVTTSGTRTFLAGQFFQDIEFPYGGVHTSPDRNHDGFLVAFGASSMEPGISKIDDVPNDQGGAVLVRFARSEYDVSTSPLTIRGYEVYLRDDPLPFAVAAQDGARAEAWMLVGEAPAHGIGGYVTLASSLADSTVTDGMHTSTYKVRAVTDDPSLWFDSPAKGGYSLDNLAPGLPLNLVIENGELTWKSAGDADISHYTIYGADGAFDESAVLIDYATDTRLALGGRSFTNYYVTATDRAGNEGKAAGLHGAPAGGREAPRTLSVSAYPNPFNPETTIRYTLPSAGVVRVDVFDASGGLVRQLVNAQQPPGAFTARWDGRSASGDAVGSGIYFARVQHNGSSRAYKLVMLK